jgi:hypothetical protein
MWWWIESKTYVEQSVSFSSDSLHVLGGVLVQMGAAVILKRPLSSLGPWLIAFALISLNEFIDVQIPQWPDAATQFGESTKDMALTLALPTVLLFAARRFPWLWTSRRSS